MKEFWDQRYSEQEFVYGKEPNSFFKTFIDREKPASILLPAEGEGRNAIYAAQRGWEVYANDYSRVARDKAIAWAQSESVSIHYELIDLSAWNPSHQTDAIAMLYVHLKPPLRREIHKNLVGSLKPGGKIILEAFSKDQIHFKSGGPMDIDMLYDVDMIELDFQELDILMLEKLITKIGAGDAHKGKGSIIRLIGQKKKS